MRATATRPILIATALAMLALASQPAASTAATQLDQVRLDWTGNEELQRKAFNGQINYFSAGVSDGLEATYKAVDGNVQIVYRAAGSQVETTPTYATRGAHVNTSGLGNNGGRQIVRISAGTGVLQDDGSAVINWTGAFSVNFYGSLVPFTLADPVLSVDASGNGTLKADLSGFGSDINDPDNRHPLTPVGDVTVATFSGVQLATSGTTEITPNYASVAVSLPGGEQAQVTTGSWGAWPQPFVDFQLQTGLGSYWYTSGSSADAYKPPYPFTVTPGSAQVILPPTPSPPPAPTPPPTPTVTTPPPPAVTTTPVPILPSITAPRKTVRVGAKRRARLATLRCPASRCTVKAPRTVRVRIGGKSYRLTVLAPRSLSGRKSGALELVLTKAAAKRLQGRSAKTNVKISLSNERTTVSKTVKVTIKGR